MLMRKPVRFGKLSPMALTYKDNPFRPDFGGIPPLLAGRTEELLELTTGLQQLQDGTTPATILISAPRGMGKSVLLNRLKEESDRTGIKVRKNHAGDIKTLQQLTEWLAPDLVERTRASGVSGGGKFLGAGVDYRSSQGAAFGEPAWTIRLQNTLLERHQNKPLIICVDEAHTLIPEVALALGSLRHQMNDNKRPVWLLLAGTPGLSETLRDAKATFIERVTRLKPTLLSAVESAEVLHVPLTERGWQVNETTLADIVEDSQGYPYFLQLWGREVWKAGVSLRRARLDGDTLARAAVSVNRQRDEFYFNRYVELMDTPQSDLFQDVDIITVTLAVINVVSQRQAASLLDINGAISACLPSNRVPAPIRRYFETKGFIWAAKPDQYVPGIPSLMDYVEEKLDS